MNTTLKALSGWRSYRRFMASQEHFLEDMDPYYKHRLEDAPFSAMVVFLRGVSAMIVTFIVIIVR